MYSPLLMSRQVFIIVLDNLVVDITAMLVMSYLNNLFVPLLGQGLVAGLWILLAMGVTPSCRDWVVD